MGEIFEIAGVTGTSLPNKNVDGTVVRARMARYGEVGLKDFGSKKGAVEEGSSFIVVNPTLGTGVALGVAAATAVIQTAPSILIYNNDVVGGKNIIMDSLKLIVTGAGTAGTRLDLSIYLDSTTRYTSGGTAGTPVNLNMGVTT
ncbi:MAG TPA: hypothetical protein VN604_06390, partial [Nitrospirota bacterium]|nr:hypothetical protein [Nitrospirota bacterium]